ncbi:MAG: RNA recognition motif domain-containing protein [Microcystaceae cyanobacterium]
MPVRLYVGNLPKEPIERDSLQNVFAEGEEDNASVISTKIIKDRKTGKCRGFAFVTVNSEEDADKFIEEYNGKPFMEASLRIERAQPRTKGKSKEEEGKITEENSSPNVTNKENRKKSGKKGKGRGGNSNKQPESIQPDPRWASQLAEIKEMLAASNN